MLADQRVNKKAKCLNRTFPAGATKPTGGTSSSVCTHLHSPDKWPNQAPQVQTPVWVGHGCGGRVAVSLEQAVV